MLFWHANIVVVVVVVDDDDDVVFVFVVGCWLLLLLLLEKGRLTTGLPFPTCQPHFSRSDGTLNQHN
jgi:hypothetical protein